MTASRLRTHLASVLGRVDQAPIQVTAHRHREPRRYRVAGRADPVPYPTAQITDKAAAPTRQLIRCSAFTRYRSPRQRRASARCRHRRPSTGSKGTASIPNFVASSLPGSPGHQTIRPGHYQRRCLVCLRSASPGGSSRRSSDRASPRHPAGHLRGHGAPNRPINLPKTSRELRVPRPRSSGSGGI